MEAVVKVPHGFVGDCMIETAEGPVAMADTPGKGFAVLTRLSGGQLGFRQLLKVSASGPVPLLRVVFDTGQAAVVARGQVFYRAGMEAVRAEALRYGEQLETAFAYPPGYVPPDASRPVATAIAVRLVEPAGDGQVWSGTVRDTHTLFLAVGVLCAE
jgi:hypothetical protein